MYESPAPPKKEIPYRWIVAGLSALSLSLLIITVTYAFEASKNEDALAASRAEAAAKESALKSTIDAMAFEISLMRAKQGVSEPSASLPSSPAVSNAQHVIDEPKINDLTAGLAKLRTDTKSDSISSGKSNDDFFKGILKERLIAEAIKAVYAGNPKLAKDNFQAVLLLDPYDVSAREGLTAAVASETAAAKVLGENLTWIKINKDYLEKIDADTTVTKTASGLRFKVISLGAGERPKPTSKVKCLYEGKFVDGRVFDSTKARNNEPAELQLNLLIPLWREGLEHIGVGGKIMLYCPPALAYGEKGRGSIPGNSVLIFEIELVGITN
jgi:FKBP-type peptidyl-prolyl cis-trans isomerase FkpA